jgi:hypothetical protein
MTYVRAAAIETGRAADRVTRLLERAVALLESKSWAGKFADLARPADSIVDRIFWRGVILIVLLILAAHSERRPPAAGAATHQKRR